MTGPADGHTSSGMVLGFAVGLIFGPAVGTWAPLALALCAGVGLLCDAALEQRRSSRPDAATRDNH